ncbi:unnamed protein product, partial [Ectocarpus sp. 12 AP-2014]
SLLTRGANWRTDASFVTALSSWSGGTSQLYTRCWPRSAPEPSELSLPTTGGAAAASDSCACTAATPPRAGRPSTCPAPGSTSGSPWFSCSARTRRGWPRRPGRRQRTPSPRRGPHCMTVGLIR